MFAKVPSDPAERLYQKHVFADYRPHEDPSGETIWFPYQAVYTYHVGNLRDGTPVECNTDTIIVKRIAFNTEIPEERFVLSFPEGTTVYDWSKGPETLETGKTPVAFPASGVSPLASRGNLSWWVLVAAVACIMLLLGAMVFRRRLASRKASP
jgi:hypothetical protein